MTDSTISFQEAIRSAGLEPPGEIEPGKLHRFPGIGKRNGNTAGWCRLFPDMQGGVYGDWSTGMSESWQAERKVPMNEAEQAAFRLKVKEAQKQVHQERKRKQEEAAIEAQKRWDSAQQAKNDHPYLTQKDIQAYGIRQEGSNLLIPLRDDTDRIWALQTIAPDGSKFFSPKGCRTKGLYFSISGKPSPETSLCIAEGFATAVAIHVATGYPVAVAFNAANIAHVAKKIKEKLPNVDIVICADDDQKPDNDNNPGIEAAEKAARFVNGKVAHPEMNKKADFWDLLHEQGPDAVRAAIMKVQETVDSNTVIQRLAGLSDIEYDQKREDAAKKLGIRTTTLDREVKKARKNKPENDQPFDEPEPWPEPVDPPQLLTDIANTVRRFIVCSQEVANAVALWVAMTWFIDSVHVAPLAIITAPEKRCGKTQLLSLLGKLSAKAITASNISPAALYRTIEKWNPTLLIDEVDACLKDNEELRGIINAGHTRDSAYTIRCVGDNHEPKTFNLWGAKALSGIGHVADTLMDRAVIMELRRKLPYENIERLRHAEPDLFSNLRSKLARFADDYSEQVRLARPPLPESLNDRAQDNWEPLLAIAMVAGESWLDKGTSTALKLSGNESAAQTVGTELLSDIQEIFEMKGVDRIKTTDLIMALCEDDEKMWLTYNRGKAITARQLSNRLKEYGIRSKNIRIGNDVAKGFSLEQFSEAFSRYITPPVPPLKSTTMLQSNENNTLGVADRSPLPLQTLPKATALQGNVADKALRSGSVAGKEIDKSLISHNCSGLADKTPLRGATEKTSYSLRGNYLMSAAELIRHPNLTLTVVGNDLKIKTDRPLAPVLITQLKQHKAEIIQLLLPGKNIPSWCQVDCPQLEFVDLPNEGPVPGCVNIYADHEEWSRLDKLNECPMRREIHPRKKS